VLADTHCHLDLPRFDEDRPAVIERAIVAGVTRILIPALDYESSRSVLSLADAHPALFAAIGVHPSESGKWAPESRDQFRNLALGSSLPSKAQPEVPGLAVISLRRRLVAFGEIGLDYYWDAAPHAVQQDVLRAELDLA